MCLWCNPEAYSENVASYSSLTIILENMMSSNYRWAKETPVQSFHSFKGLSWGQKRYKLRVLVYEMEYPVILLSGEPSRVRWALGQHEK